MIKILPPTMRKKSKGIIAVRIILLLLIILNLILIWTNSAKVSEESNKTSTIIAEGVAKKVVKDFEILDKSQQKTHVKELNTKIRSMAHFGEFIPLGLLFCFLWINIFDKKENKEFYFLLSALVFALLMSGLCALFDEIHQIFVKGRSFQLIDIATDTFGAFCGSVSSLLARGIFVFSKK